MSTESSSSTQSFTFEADDFYHVLLLDKTREDTKMLLYSEKNEWSLPYFEYQDVVMDGTTIPSVCVDFKHWLGINDDEVYFTGSVELLGDRYYYSRITPEKLGRVQLLLVEPHGITSGEIELPDGAEWKRAEFVPIDFPEAELALHGIMGGAILSCMDSSGSFLQSLSDERCRPGWYESASRFLVELVSSFGAQTEGHVVQRHLSCTSTMLKLHSSLGCYFLKSPAHGCNETQISATVSKLFPQFSPSIVGISKELNCFVSREFNVNDPVDIRAAVMALGKLQLESRKHLKALSEAGCPVRDIDGLEKALHEWPQKFDDFNMISRDPVLLLPVIAELGKELKTFNIPMALVHGDFTTGNVGFQEVDGRKDLVIFDWEYAYIGHPFCDFHRVHKWVSKDLLDEYLRLWSDFEDISRARRAYRIAKHLGHAVRAWSYLDWASACNAQDPPYLSTHAFGAAAACAAKICP